MDNEPPTLAQPAREPHDITQITLRSYLYSLKLSIIYVRANPSKQIIHIHENSMPNKPLFRSYNSYSLTERNVAHHGRSQDDS